jgi:uncharacterized protein YbaR (Trm112 family)
MCRGYPLRLESIEAKVLHNRTNIIKGILLCSKCKRWYPIINGIPRMLPDEFREDYGHFIKDLPKAIYKKYKFNRKFFTKFTS